MNILDDADFLENAVVDAFESIKYYVCASAEERERVDQDIARIKEIVERLRMSVQ